MNTSVQASLVRSVGPFSFAHITTAPVLAIEGQGVLFGGALTDEEVGDVWWWVTSRDDTDQAARENIAALRSAATAPTGTADDVKALALAVSAYLLGIEGA